MFLYSNILKLENNRIEIKDLDIQHPLLCVRLRQDRSSKLTKRRG